MTLSNCTDQGVFQCAPLLRLLLQKVVCVETDSFQFDVALPITSIFQNVSPSLLCLLTLEEPVHGTNTPWPRVSSVWCRAAFSSTVLFRSFGAWHLHFGTMCERCLLFSL